MTYMERHYPPLPEWSHYWSAQHEGPLPDVPPACPVRMPSWLREQARDGVVLPPLFTMAGVWD